MYTVIAIVLLSLAEIVEAYYFAGALKSERRQNARERELLINQILNLAGRPWQEPPAIATAPIEREPDFDLDRYVTSFSNIPPEEQFPVPGE